MKKQFYSEPILTLSYTAVYCISGYSHYINIGSRFPPKKHLNKTTNLIKKKKRKGKTLKANYAPKFPERPPQSEINSQTETTCKH